MGTSFQPYFPSNISVLISFTVKCIPDPPFISLLTQINSSKKKGVLDFFQQPIVPHASKRSVIIRHFQWPSSLIFSSDTFEECSKTKMHQTRAGGTFQFNETTNVPTAKQLHNVGKTFQFFFFFFSKLLSSKPTSF